MGTPVGAFPYSGLLLVLYAHFSLPACHATYTAHFACTCHRHGGALREERRGTPYRTAHTCLSFSVPTTCLPHPTHHHHHLPTTTTANVPFLHPFLPPTSLLQFALLTRQHPL